MKPHTTQQNSAISYRALIALFVATLALSGCGLVMDSNDRLDRGEAALAEGDFRAAIIDAKDVLLKEPDNVRGRLLLGRAALASVDGPAAEKELRRAIELGTDKTLVAVELAQALLLQRKYQEVLDEIPLEGLASPDDEAAVRVAQGDALLALKQPEPARAMYMSVLDLRPDDRDARLGIVSSFIAEGNSVQARANLDLILETNSDDPEVWLFAGSFSTRSRDFDSAVSSFSRALELADSRQDASGQDDTLYSMRLEVLAGLAETLLEKRDIDSARKRVEQLVGLAPDYLPAKLLVARIAFFDQDWNTAQQNLQQILQVAPSYQPAQVMLGAVHLQSGNLAQAEMYLSAAVAARPDDVRARQFLAECRLKMHRNEDARQALEPILGVANPDPVSLQLAARASLGSRDIDEAIEFLRRNVEEQPDNPDLRFQLAMTLLQVGRTDAARSVLDEIDVSGSPENAYRRDALAVLTRIGDGNAAEALRDAEKLVNTYDDRAAAYSLLGAVQSSTGDLEQAKNSFARSAELNPGNVVALRSLAEIDESEGNLESAKSRYLEVLEEQPDAAWALAALGRIAFSEQDFETAASNLRRAHELAPENVGYRLNLARIEYQNGNAGSAASLLEDEIESTLDHVPSGIMLGTIKAQAGDAESALDIAAELQERHSSEAAPHAFEGDVHLETGDLVAADKAYDKALSMDTIKRYALRSHQIKRRLGVANSQRPLLNYLEARPLDYEVRAILAESYMQTDDVSKSIRTYEKIASEQPGNAVVLNNLAWGYYLADDPRAIETARKAHDAMPESGAIVDTLGWILVENGELAEGEALLRKAVEMEQGRPDIQYHHAVALARLQRTEEARTKLEKILSGDLQFSGRSDAERLLAEL